MVDVVLVITSIVVLLFICFCSAKYVVYFSHPDDSGNLFAKIVVILGLTLAALVQFMLPLDAVNTQQNGGFNMEICWDIMLVILAVALLLVLPFAYFYYEAASDLRTDEEEPAKNVKRNAMLYTLIMLFVFAVVLAVGYTFMNTADVPVQIRTISFKDRAADSPPLQNPQCTEANGCTISEGTIEVSINWAVFLTCLFTFVGSFLFSCFVGVGLAAVPVDFINNWRTRPKPMTKAEYERAKNLLGSKAIRLRKLGESIKSSEREDAGKAISKKEKKSKVTDFNKFQVAVAALKDDYCKIEIAHKEQGGNPFYYGMFLIVGICGAIITLTWVLHICLFVLPSTPIPFLNEMFVALTIPGFPLFSTILYIFYSAWLLLCVYKGNQKFGLRVPGLFRLYPMAPGDTRLSSFLANTWILLICSLPAVQFCTISFPEFARNTSVDLLFGSQIRYLKFFKYFFDNNVFVWMLLVFVFLTTFYMCLYPPSRTEDLDNRIRELEVEEREATNPQEKRRWWQRKKKTTKDPKRDDKNRTVV